MPDPAAFQQAFGAMLFGTGPAPGDPALERTLAVHRNTSAKAAHDALVDNFPVVRMLVNGDAFTAAAADFVAASPPRDPRLCLYGCGFPAFLSVYPPFAEISYLADVALIERFATEALFAADAPALDAAAFVTDLDAPLRLHPAARYAFLETPAGSIGRAHATDDPGTALAAIDWTAETALVTRPHDALIVTVLPPGAVLFLEACAMGRPLGQAASACGGDLSAIFALLLSAGAFTRTAKDSDT